MPNCKNCGEEIDNKNTKMGIDNETPSFVLSSKCEKCGTINVFTLRIGDLENFESQEVK